MSNESLKEKISLAIDGVVSKLGVTYDEDLYQSYKDGVHPELLSYEKVKKSQINLSALQKYIFGSRTAIEQPCQYYDIYRACRHTTFIRILNHSLDIAMHKVKNHRKIFNRFLTAQTYDDFDACLFELAVAGRYAESKDVDHVELVEESKQRRMPDISAKISGRNVFIECKKINRQSDAALEERNKVRKHLMPILHHFRGMYSFLVEIELHVDIENILQRDIVQAICHSRDLKMKIETRDFSLKYIHKICEHLDQYMLWPSPQYDWERFSYVDGKEWQGLVSSMEARFMQWKTQNHYPLNVRRSSNWLDSVRWEAAIKWRYTDPEIMNRQKKINYKRIIEGIGQLNNHCDDGLLHIWFERNGAVGNRQNQLIDIRDNLLTKEDFSRFGCVIFNETQLSVSPDGTFDFIEHGHYIEGNASRRQKFNTLIFGDSDIADSEFGIGAELSEAN